MVEGLVVVVVVAVDVSVAVAVDVAAVVVVETDGDERENATNAPPTNIDTIKIAIPTLVPVFKQQSL